MSLEYAILGFLNYRPLSGYDLKKLFDESVHHFWPADQSQIYRTLNRLQDKGWTEQEFIPQADRPNRKVHHITSGGQSALQAWLTAPLPPQDERHARLIQVFFAGQLADEEIIRLFEHTAEETRAILAVYDQISASLSPDLSAIGSARETYFWMLTLDMGKRKLTAYLGWIEQVIQDFQEGRVPAP